MGMTDKQEQEQESRAEFEAWALLQPWIKDVQRYPDGEYGHYETRKAWSSWQASRAAMGAEQVLCERCQGSGEDPEGFLTHGRGPDDETVGGPCRECGGDGAEPVELTAQESNPMTANNPKALSLAQMLEALGWRSVDKDLRNAAAELRRLHAENEQLRVSAGAPVELPKPDAWVESSTLDWVAGPLRGPAAVSSCTVYKTDCIDGLEPVFRAETVHALLAEANAERDEFKDLYEQVCEQCDSVSTGYKKLEAELVKESGRTAEQKLRADQMTKQFNMQCAMNKQAYAEAEDAKRRASRAGVEMYAAMQGRHA